jgi:hypothetical protein
MKSPLMHTRSLWLRWLVLGLTLGGLTRIGAASAPNTPEGLTLVASKETVAIARDGKALLSIVIAPESSEEMKKTAAELAGYLKRMTGAEFAVKQGREPEGITLGTLTQFPDDTLKEAMAVRDGFDGIEAMAIRSDGGRIRLLGNTDLGASHAAYRLLELMGCRWFFMGSNWEIVPQAKDLSFGLNECDRPRIWSRRYGFTRMNHKREEGEVDSALAFQRWEKANRMEESLKVNCAHAWHAIPDAFKLQGYPFKKEFASHPEYFALVDGKRMPPQLCVANPGLQKVVVQYAQQYFEVNPKADMVSLDAADQPGWCTCADCAKLGPPSIQPFYLANLVARELQKSHPGKYIGLLAYSWRSDPPDFAMEPNIFIQLTAGMNASKLSFDELFKAWGEKCRHLGIYEYFSYWEMDRCLLPGKGPQNNLSGFAARMKRYTDHKVIQIGGDAANSWGAHGLGYYVAQKLMWNPSADGSALKNDFYEKAFGPAAPAMARYFERLDLANRPFRGIAMLRPCLADLEAATALAGSRPDVLARLDDLKANLVYNSLALKVDDAANEADEKSAALEWFKWAYRIRNSFMVDWMTFRSAVGNHEYKRTLAFKFKEPSWNYRTTKENPWRDSRPVTSAELAERLQKMKAEWGEAPAFEERTFSERCVLVQFPGTGKAESKRAFLGSIVQLIASQKGESLRFKVISTPSPEIERQDAKYSLATLDGQEVAKGELPEGESSMDLKVPGPGIYAFTCKRGGAGWRMELPEGLHSAVVVRRELEFRPQFMTAFFYVPKGVSQVVLYVQDGSVTVRDPGKQVAYQGRVKGDFIPMTVKPGMDGKVWSITGKFRNLWFLNTPTVLSASSEMVFVPKEVAAQDGLKVVIQ